MNKLIKIFFSVVVISTLIASCSDDDDNSGNNTANLTLQFSGLDDSSTNEVYEGWIIVTGTPVSTGTFTVSGGNMSKTVFPVNSNDLANATDFVLSIEPANDSDPAPSDIKVLGGSFSGNTATATVAHAAALGDSFASASGKFLLATPTDGNANMNEDSGVWFIDNSGGTPAVGLSLPTLPSNWRYEGWVVIDGTPISTGTFTSVTGADSFSGYSGTAGMAPPFPGEDLLMNAPSGVTFPTDIRGKAVVISIEPNPDNSPAPFMFKPLLKMVDAAAATHTPIDLGANALPTGMATR